MTKLNTRLSLAAVTLAACVGTAAAQDFDRQTLQLASIEPPTTVWGQAAQRFADAVEERTGGAVTVELALSGTTGSVRETLEALTFGTGDVVVTVVSALGPFEPLAAIESYPYLIRDAAHFDAVFNGPVGEELYAEIGERSGFHIAGAGFRGARQMASTRAVESVDDLAGLKMRVPGINIFRQTWETLGASPVPMSSSQVYTSLLQGVIDAAENPLAAHLRSKYHEAADYVIITDHVHGAYTFVFDGARFSGFSPELQAVLNEEAEAAMNWGTEQSLAQIAGYESELEGLGATIIRPDTAAFREKIAPLADQYPDLKPWIEKVQAVQ